VNSVPFPTSTERTAARTPTRCCRSQVFGRTLPHWDWRKLTDLASRRMTHRPHSYGSGTAFKNDGNQIRHCRHKGNILIGEGTWLFGIHSDAANGEIPDITAHPGWNECPLAPRLRGIEFDCRWATSVHDNRLPADDFRQALVSIQKHLYAGRTAATPTKRCGSASLPLSPATPARTDAREAGCSLMIVSSFSFGVVVELTTATARRSAL